MGLLDLKERLAGGSRIQSLAELNPDWGSLQANQMSASSQTDNLVCTRRHLIGQTPQ
jgi:hypothetical protein